LGFLCFNLPPASIFLGDAGSMLIGMMLGAMAIRASLKGPGTVLLAAPLAVLAIPILDTGMAIVRRKLTGRSIYATDRGHLHHQLFEHLGSSAKVLGFVSVCCALTCGAGLAGLWFKSDLIALVTCAGLLSVLAAAGFFGRGELQLLAARGRRLSMAFATPIIGRSLVSRQSQVRLQGTREWELLWEGLTETAEKLKLRRVQLDVNLPRMHESFNAVWERPGDSEREDQWQVSVPLTISDRTVGRLIILGQRNGHQVCREIESLVDFIETFEQQFGDFAAETVLGGIPRPQPQQAVAER
jgi:UDP-GlcNAc:undecaprenyl-phosphate GlcNAc-1-phosphate transferase